MTRSNHLTPCKRRGVTALIAMLFLMLITTLTLAMFHVAGANVQTSANFSDLSRAHAAAESGLRWTSYRFAMMPRPREMSGSITPAVAADVWNRVDGLRERLAANLAQARDQANAPVVVKHNNGDRVWTTTEIPTDIQGATFDVVVRQLGPADGFDARYIRVIATGKYRKGVRSVSMDFEMEKRAKFAVVGKVPLQFGRNTLVQGPVGMTTKRFPPVLILSDFTHFHDGLKAKVLGFQSYLKATGTFEGKTVKNHDGYDNRISVNNFVEYTLATKAGYRDVNEDSYIDDFDLFVSQFDTDKDGKVAEAEFKKPDGTMYEPNLFAAMDSLSPPQFNEDRNGNGYLDHGEDLNGNGDLDADPIRKGYKDGVISKEDGYSKFNSQVLLAATALDWENWIKANAAGNKISDYVQGGIAPLETGMSTMKFGATENEMLDLNPQNFEVAAEEFRKKTGPTMGAVVRVVGRIENTILAPADTAYSVPYGPATVRVMSVGDTKLKLHDVIAKTAFDAANAALIAGKVKATSAAPVLILDEHAPFGSTSWQATYRRPVFHRIAFTNVRIPKGMNALFENCTFKGVTFVEVQRDIKNSSGAVTYNKDEAMSWSQKMKSGSFGPNVVLTKDNSQGFELGNNLRFHNSTFEGPIASNYATAYSHFTNSWEFTGATMFDNKVDQTATLVAPQTNIEMGSFTDPNAAPSTLIGVVVAGNIDIRGTSVVDGSIIVTGDGAGNTTLGYFGDNDGNTNSGAMAEGGYGRLSIYYNPYRALPHGINIPVGLRALINTYKEGLR